MRIFEAHSWGVATRMEDSDNEISSEGRESFDDQSNMMCGSVFNDGVLINCW